MNALLVFALHGVLALLLLLAALSRRLGNVTKRPPLHRLIYLGAGTVILGALLSLWLPSLSLEGLAASVLIISGLLAVLLVAWRYWGWVLYE